MRQVLLESADLERESALLRQAGFRLPQVTLGPDRAGLSGHRAATQLVADKAPDYIKTPSTA